MVELNGNPEQAKESATAAVGPVDLVIGLSDAKAGEDISRTTNLIRDGLRELRQPVQTAILYKSGFAAPQSNGERQENDSLHLLSYTSSVSDPSATYAQTIAADYRAIVSASESLNARAYALIATDVEAVTPEWIHRLATPVIEQNYDLVSPLYVFHRFEGVLTSGILYPLIRSVYGKRIHNPLGPDFGASARFLQQILQGDSTRPKTSPLRITVPLGPEAVSRGYQVCQANLGERKHPPVDWKNLSSLLAEVLGPLFAAMERDAPMWQRVRGSEPVATFGPPLPSVTDKVEVDVKRLHEPFQLGFRNLQEIWALLLPPKTLFELQRLGRMGPEQFRMPDELWVRIIYDFSLGYRLRSISRDHLLRALTPLYLGWVASYAVEVEKMDARATEHRIERLCGAFEAGKPYLVSRWRWPDRFNP
jgi:glucosylglycerate synthase